MPNLTTLQISLSKSPPPKKKKQKTKTKTGKTEKHLSQLSSNEVTFTFSESAPFYEDKLHQPGYQQKIKYNPVNIKTHNKRNHKRNITGWIPLSIEMYPQKLANIFKI